LKRGGVDVRKVDEQNWKEYISTADSVQAEGWGLELDPGIISRLKGFLSEHQLKQLDGILCTCTVSG
jgi:hypothetical protein